MRIAVITIVLLLMAAVIGFVRSGSDDSFTIVQVVPLIDGQRPSLMWIGAAGLMIAISWAGIRRMTTR